MRLVVFLMVMLPIFADAGPGGYPSIFWAALANDVHMARHYVSHGGSVNIRDENNMTPLMYAADKGNYEMVEFLLMSRADPFAQFGSSYAVDLGRNDKVRRLLQLYMWNGRDQ